MVSTPSNKASLNKQVSKPDFGNNRMSPAARKMWNKPITPRKADDQQSRFNLPSNRAGSKTRDGDLLSSMSQRLAQLEKLNQALRSEVKEKITRVRCLEQENENLRLTSDAASLQEVQ